MKFIALLGLAFASGSLATASALSGRERLSSDTDLELERIDDVLPSQTVKLYKRRRGGGGGGGVDFDDDDDDDDDDDYDDDEDDGGSSEPPPCVETPYVLEDPRTNSYGYDFNPDEGLGSDETDIIGGYTKNGSGTPPEWRNDSGSWVHICDNSYDYEGDEYYFGGSKVPFPAGERSPNGLVPSLTELPFPEDEELPDWIIRCRERADSQGECPLRNSHCYKYPYSYEYTESDRDYDSDINGYTYDNTTTNIDMLCCCTENFPCGCDDTGDASLVKAIGDHHCFFDTWGYMELDNSTAACYLDINGSKVFAFNGTLEEGSTKANASLPDYPDTTETSVCYPSSSHPLYGVSYSLLLAIAVGAVWFSS